jgi:predicted aconitase
MVLSEEEKRMLDDHRCQGRQRALNLLLQLAEAHDAERLVPVSYAHVAYDFCPEDFWNTMTEGVSGTPHRVTTHPSYSPEVWTEWGLPIAEAWRGEHERKLRKFIALGWLRTETCAEYLLGISPQKGDIVPMAGSCMQIANNSLFGAKVDRMGTLPSLAAAVCGRTPLMGLLLPENRHADYVFELEDVDVTHWTSSHYHCLGYCIGNQVPGYRVIAVNGLPPKLPFDFARALVISMPTSGTIALAHVVGTTPEAPTLASALGGKKPETIRVGKKDLENTWETLNFGDDDIVEHVAFGCPHATIDEIGRISALLAGKKIRTTLLIGASVSVEALARRQGWAGIIEKAGGRFLSACPSIGNPFTRADIAGDKKAKSAATNSARCAHYLASVSGVKVFFGTVQDCLNAAVTGRWKGRAPKW